MSSCLPDLDLLIWQRMARPSLCFWSSSRIKSGTLRLQKLRSQLRHRGMGCGLRQRMRQSDGHKRCVCVGSVQPGPASRVCQSRRAKALTALRVFVCVRCAAFRLVALLCVCHVMSCKP